MRAFALLFGIVIAGLLVPDVQAQCYSGGYYYYTPTYYSPPVYYTQPTYYYTQPTTIYYSPVKKVAPKVTDSYDEYYTKKIGIKETSSFDRPPIITESRSFDRPKVGEFVTPGPVEDKLPLKKVEMPKPDPEVKALKENVMALQESIKELKELVRQQQAELTKAKAPVVAPEPRKIELPSPMKKPSEFDKEPKK